MTPEAGARAQVVSGGIQPLWFLGTLLQIKLDGAQTAGRFALVDGVFPHGAAPPLHSHPQDETFYLLEGELTAWVVDRELGENDRGDRPAWVTEYAQSCRAGAVVFAPGGVPHTFRVESDTARVLFLSTPAGIEEMFRALGEPAKWPWLPPPPDGPRVSPERIAEVEREVGMVRLGPPPPSG
ncbi:MAG TPA: cupin domain-containing protein [Solirubrobacteraceae bacterium]|nr:cupin domain-containing protein [Solirubrobacteraceae bacterium]